MSADAAFALIFCTIVVVFGLGLGVSSYHDHVEAMAKIERGCHD